ncbi:hypothetical protein NDU88_005734 [Pleurodeles waltl]|uniref:Uncharacterized protein n=1 Tax=Pleurodeles waltl TaxID=8319 RepID=A0AAV7PIZ5_PLEWA|nr:hypothetical protein NDU88_005734 [Pleurodeles waltl]
MKPKSHPLIVWPLLGRVAAPYEVTMPEADQSGRPPHVIMLGCLHLLSDPIRGHIVGMRKPVPLVGIIRIVLPFCAIFLALAPSAVARKSNLQVRREPLRRVPCSTPRCSYVAPTRRDADPACLGSFVDRAPGCVVHEVPHFGVGISDIASSSSCILIPPLMGCRSVTSRCSAPSSHSHVRPLRNRRAQGFSLHIGCTHHMSTATTLRHGLSLCPAMCRGSGASN